MDKKEKKPEAEKQGYNFKISLEKKLKIKTESNLFLNNSVST